MQRFVCKFRSQCAKSRFEYLEATTQWGFEKPLSRITNDSRLRGPHLVLSDEAAVPRFDTLTTKVGDSPLVQ